MSGSVRRILLGFLLAPISSPLIVSLQFGRFDWRLVGATLTVAYVALAFFALPLFYVLHRLGWRQWWHFVAAGLVACYLFLVYDSWSASGDIRLWALPHAATRFLLHAAPAALLFWIIAVRPRRIEITP